MVVDHRARRVDPHIVAHASGWSVRAFSGSSGVGPGPGGVRGVVCGFSVESRRRMRVKLMQVDWSAVDCMWVTLTYHEDWGADWRDWKADLRAFEARLDRRWPHMGDVWRLEFQQRGAPHFHMIVCWDKGRRPDAGIFGRWVRAAWGAVIGTVVGRRVVDMAAWRHGTSAVAVRVQGPDGVGKLLGYVLKDMAKVDQGGVVNRDTGEVMATGRVWGVRGTLPTVSDETIEFESDEGYQKFLARLNEHGRSIGSWYLASVSEVWPGFVVLGDRRLLASQFLDGIRYRVVT